MERNPVGFLMLLALALCIAFTLIRALRTGEIFSAGMYSFKKDRSPLMYWMVLIVHAGIVDWLLHTMINLVQTPRARAPRSGPLRRNCVHSGAAPAPPDPPVPRLASPAGDAAPGPH